MGKLYSRSVLSSDRRALRNAATAAERLLWGVLRNRRLDGFKFRRQHSIGSYIVDFYCPSARLAVELDGSAHDSLGGQGRDGARDAYLASLGVRVLRFDNETVRRELDAVVQLIGKMAAATVASPLAR